MKRGMFLVANEPSDNNIDRRLEIGSGKCDVFSAQVYVPQVNKKLEKIYLWFCVLATLVPIAVIGCNIGFDIENYMLYALPLIMEISFFITYAMKTIWMLHVQMIYLFASEIFFVLYLFVSVVPNGAESVNVTYFLPPLDMIILRKCLYVLFYFARLLLVVTYHQHLYYAQIRRKFSKGTVILQPQ